MKTKIVVKKKGLKKTAEQHDAGADGDLDRDLEVCARPVVHGRLQITRCGGALAWDPLVEGVTQGGLALVGGLRCPSCGQSYLCRRSTPRESWRLSSGGFSVETGITRIRAEASSSDFTESGRDKIRALMARVARLPELEEVLRRIASITDDAQAPDIRAMALASLGVVPGIKPEVA